MTLKEKYEREKDRLLGCAREIKRAIDYEFTENKLHGCLIYNSTSLFEKRTKEDNRLLKWIVIAENEFIKRNKKEIIKLAAEICQEYAEK